MHPTVFSAGIADGSYPIHANANITNRTWLVGEVGFEPTHLAVADFESAVSTCFTIRP